MADKVDATRGSEGVITSPSESKFMTSFVRSHKRTTSHPTAESEIVEELLRPSPQAERTGLHQQETSQPVHFNYYKKTVTLKTASVALSPVKIQPKKRSREVELAEHYKGIIEEKDEEIEQKDKEIKRLRLENDDLLMENNELRKTSERLQTMNELIREKDQQLLHKQVSEVERMSQSQADDEEDDPRLFSFSGRMSSP